MMLNRKLSANIGEIMINAGIIRHVRKMDDYMTSSFQPQEKSSEREYDCGL